MASEAWLSQPHHMPPVLMYVLDVHWAKAIGQWPQKNRWILSQMNGLMAAPEVFFYPGPLLFLSFPVSETQAFKFQVNWRWLLWNMTIFCITSRPSLARRLLFLIHPFVHHWYAGRRKQALSEIVQMSIILPVHPSSLTGFFLEDIGEIIITSGE